MNSEDLASMIRSEEEIRDELEKLNNAVATYALTVKAVKKIAKKLKKELKIIVRDTTNATIFCCT